MNSTFGDQYLEGGSGEAWFGDELILATYTCELSVSEVVLRFTSPPRQYEQFVNIKFLNSAFRCNGIPGSDFVIHRSDADQATFTSATGRPSRFRIWNGWNDVRHGPSEWNGWAGMKVRELGTHTLAINCSDGLREGPNFAALELELTLQL